MAEDSDRQAGAGSAGDDGGGGAAGEAPPPGRALHARSFKLRFAAQREQGRSYVSLVKPLGLPATVTGKFYTQERASSVDEEGTRRALQRIEDMFRRGPRELHAEPVISSQVYGWWAAAGGAAERSDRRLQHHIRDSAWLKARLCVLAADEKLKQQ
ncbi:uncharacterized protein LOC113506487 [Trichoplusia ni]|uniref:Uncharacterized protein LOC113506487 n=1 Tax=Trichoplusia ni TaxID=7111 RepID=A0A7E5WY69_TRINI|nr:uncharacterized protein LOC113506487 [Trichoplusia ni]